MSILPQYICLKKKGIPKPQTHSDLGTTQALSVFNLFLLFLVFWSFITECSAGLNHGRTRPRPVTYGRCCLLDTQGGLQRTPGHLCLHSGNPSPLH